MEPEAGIIPNKDETNKESRRAYPTTFCGPNMGHGDITDKC